MPTLDTLHLFLKKWGPTVRDGLLGILGIGTLILAVKLTVEDRLQAGGMLLTAGLLIAMVSGLSRFKSIKGLGIDAQLHELGEKLGEADRLFIVDPRFETAV